MIAQQLINGLTIGAVYAIIALGYTLAYGILGLINFAHGDIYMVGAFVSYYCVSILGLHPILAFVIALAFAAVLGALIELTAFRSIRNGSRSSQLISAIGISIILQNTVMLLGDSSTKGFPQIIENQAYIFKDTIVGTLIISKIQIIIMIVCVLLMIGLYLLIYKTNVGSAMRATSMDSNMASMMGLNVNRIISITFSIGSVLGAAAGILVGMYYNTLVYNMGSSMGLKAFVAAVLGGIGNIPGTMLGGILLGVSESMGAVFISAKYKDAFAFIILIIVLLVKPTGLFGKNRVEKV